MRGVEEVAYRGFSWIKYFAMKVFRNKIFLLLGSVMIIFFFLLPIISSSFRELFIVTIRNYPYLAPLIIVTFRFLCVVIAPLPGLPVTLASIALLPWWQAWLFNFIGTVSGAICAFLIARIYRERAVAYFTPLKGVHEWQEKLSSRKQWWTFVGLRFVSLSMFDFVAYGAGLTKMPFRTYLATLFVVDLPVSILFFYFGGIAFKYSIYILIAFACMFLSFLGVISYFKRGKRGMDTRPTA